MFANGPGDLGSIPGRVIPKTQKMVLDASLLNTQHYKVWIKGKVEQSREGVAPSPTPWCSSYRKGSLRVALDYGHQLYFLLTINKSAYTKKLSGNLFNDPGIIVFLKDLPFILMIICEVLDLDTLSHCFWDVELWICHSNTWNAYVLHRVAVPDSPGSWVWH